MWVGIFFKKKLNNKETKVEESFFSTTQILNAHAYTHVLPVVHFLSFAHCPSLCPCISPAVTLSIFPHITPADGYGLSPPSEVVSTLILVKTRSTYGPTIVAVSLAGCGVPCQKWHRYPPHNKSTRDQNGKKNPKISGEISAWIITNRLLATSPYGRVILETCSQIHFTFKC